MSKMELRISNTIKRLEKEESKLERIKVALAGGRNTYRYDENSLIKCKSDLKYLNGKLQEYQEKKLAEDEDKNNSRIREI